MTDHVHARGNGAGCACGKASPESRFATEETPAKGPG
jgi:hypothetical protein